MPAEQVEFVEEGGWHGHQGGRQRILTVFILSVAALLWNSCYYLILEGRGGEAEKARAEMVTFHASVAQYGMSNPPLGLNSPTRLAASSIAAFPNSLK